MGAPCPLNLYRPKDNPLLHATNRRPGYTGAAVPIMPKRQCCPEQMHRETMRRLKDAAAGPPLPTRKYLVLWRIKSMLKCLTLKCCHSADGYGFWQNLRPSDRWNISSFPTLACSIIKVLGGGGVGEGPFCKRVPPPQSIIHNFTKGSLPHKIPIYPRSEPATRTGFSACAAGSADIARVHRQWTRQGLPPHARASGGRRAWRGRWPPCRPVR